MADKPLQIELTPEQQELLQHQLDNGRYDNPSDVISDALRSLSERDAVDDELLRAKVMSAVASSKPPVPIDEAFTRARAAITRHAKAVKRGA
jgi:putative addiction module CopG family antidote